MVGMNTVRSDPRLRCREGVVMTFCLFVFLYGLAFWQQSSGPESHSIYKLLIHFYQKPQVYIRFLYV